MWAADGKAMSVLRSMTPLNMAAKAVSEKVGRPWIETTFNGVLLSEKQMPQIYGQAVRAARLLGMSHMPDVYLSGDRSWDCLAFGTDKDSFIVVGSALASSFRGTDMLFLLAREMGHCRVGHALWKSVIRFLLGEQGPARGFMSGGILNAIVSPTALIGGALEVPLLAWARQAEITADRAGLLAVGDEKIARRVLLTWALKSPQMYRQINIDAWIEQEGSKADSYSKLSEMTTTSTPYIAPRLRHLAEFTKSDELQSWRKYIAASLSTKKSQQPPQPPIKDVVRISCATCQTVMVIPQAVLSGKDELNVKCPNRECGKINKITKKKSGLAAKESPQADVLRIKCSSCQTAMIVPASVLAGKEARPVKCPNPQCGKLTRLRKTAKKPAKKAAVASKAK
jgi:Zn-dependent protease with chaperone function